MGEVYRARDGKLNREVAVKILPQELRGDAERRQRFEQEARAASSLNHPSIVHVYDVDSSDSVHYIAMELVEGRSLRELLTSGPLPVRKLLDLAIETADGLAKAHAAGIVHRDLKPDNLLVTSEGHVKILDFGSCGTSRRRSRGSTPACRRSCAGSSALTLALGLAVFMIGKRAGRTPRTPPPAFRQITFQRGTIGSARFAPDGETLVYGAAWEGLPVEPFLTRVGGPESRPLGFPGAEILGRALYVYRREKLPARIFSIDLATGRRQLWREIGPGEPAGILSIRHNQLTPDGQSYAYNAPRNLSDLYVVEGLN